MDLAIASATGSRGGRHGRNICWLVRNDTQVAWDVQHQHEVYLSSLCSEDTDRASYRDPFENRIEFAPSDKKVLDLELAKARKLLRPHLLLIQVLSSQFQAIKYRQPGIMTSLIRVLMRSLAAHKKMCTHPLAREVRFSLLLFGFQILASSKMEALLELRFRDRLFTAAFSWFSVRPQ